MQALILAGGEGTRLRPLTTSVPKPVIPLAGRPFLTFMIDWLASHGVDQVILSCGFLAEGVEAVLGERHGDVALRYVNEREPLGTGGPVKLAEGEGLLEDRFLVLNGDVLTDIDVGAELALHERSGARVTLALAEVEETASYGVVPTAADGQVEAFLEKQEGPVPTNRINAGCYIVEREALSLIDAGRPASLERDLFPRLVGDGLYGYLADGYWMDIGTPERYLQGTWDLLAGDPPSDLPARDESGSLVYEPTITAGAQIGPQAVIGPHCSVGSDARIERSVLHSDVSVGPDAVVLESVLATGVRVGQGARIEAQTIVGQGARIGPGAQLPPGSRIEPGAEVD
ncbi:MAG: NDP-sugar synthase [Thermoleophilaceae bacterium]|nr:NDP-sugar synthase [Thermoleophilaceae bacterium]